MITKKHLKELADIVHKAQAQSTQNNNWCWAPEIASEIKSFAQRHAPNFSESHWNDYMHKLKKAEENANS